MHEALDRLRFIGTMPSDVQNVLITGLGGSGIGGTIAAEVLARSCSVPVCVNKDYGIPAWVNAHTLVVACSYSGNTEETLAATDKAREAGSSIAVVASGGQLLAKAEAEGWVSAKLPEGYPPRAAFGHGLITLLGLLNAAGLYSDWDATDLHRVADELEQSQESIRNTARDLTDKLANRIPVIYAATGLEGVAVRWRQQINENAKILCWHHVLPEMNHNELVGWAGGDNRMGVVMLRSKDDHPRTSLRMDLNMKLMRKQTDCVVEVNAHGTSRMERLYYLVHVGDWLSYYLAVQRQVDPIEVNVITELKNELARH